MKKVAIMQPYLFPYIGYFQLLYSVDEFVLYNDVNHIVRGWINRNNYLIDGQKKLITLSVVGASSNKKINELEFLGDFERFKRTLHQAYSRALNREKVMEVIDNIFLGDDKAIEAVVKRSFEEISKYLELEVPQLTLSSDIDGHSSLKGQEKILAICNKLGADIYINPLGGKELYNKEEFQKHGIELRFIQPQIEKYKQFDNEFIPGLSMIDVLMFNSPATIAGMLKNYELI